MFENLLEESFLNLNLNSSVSMGRPKITAVKSVKEGVANFIFAHSTQLLV